MRRRQNIWRGKLRLARHGGIPRGFTLIEIVIALAIVMMILGMAALNMNALNTERKLRDVTATLRDFARRARAEALIQQRGFQIAFLPDGFAVQGVVVPDEEQQALGRLIADEEFEPRIENFKTYEMLEEMQLEVHRFGEDDWRPAAGQTWRFEHTGICEPISIRVKNEDGFIELQFNPLTAAVEDESYEIR